MTPHPSPARNRPTGEAAQSSRPVLHAPAHRVNLPSSAAPPDRSEQLRTLGISADAFHGLVLIEIDGPPVIALSPAEFREFSRHACRAYHEAMGDLNHTLQERPLT